MISKLVVKVGSGSSTQFGASFAIDWRIIGALRLLGSSKSAGEVNWVSSNISSFIGL